MTWYPNPITGPDGATITTARRPPHLGGNGTKSAYDLVYDLLDLPDPQLRRCLAVHGAGQAVIGLRHSAALLEEVRIHDHLGRGGDPAGYIEWESYRGAWKDLAVHYAAGEQAEQRWLYEQGLYTQTRGWAIEVLAVRERVDAAAHTSATVSYGAPGTADIDWQEIRDLADVRLARWWSQVLTVAGQLDALGYLTGTELARLLRIRRRPHEATHVTAAAAQTAARRAQADTDPHRNREPVAESPRTGEETSAGSRPTAAGAGMLGKQPDPGGRSRPGDDAVLPGSSEPPAVDPDTVVEAARVATAHNWGNPVRGHHVLNTAVWVDLTSWPRVQEAATYLNELGYQVSAGPAPDGYGWSVTVSGWSPRGLYERALALEWAVGNLETYHKDVADLVIDRFHSYLQGMDDGAARRQAIADTPRTPTAPAALGPDMAQRDLIAGPPEFRGALVRVAIAQQAWQILATTDVAQQAIDKYVELRQVHHYDVEPARAEAVAEISRKAQAAYHAARSTLARNLKAGQQPVPDRSGHHRRALPEPGTQSARPAFGTPPGGGTGSPAVQPPTPGTMPGANHRGR